MSHQLLEGVGARVASMALAPGSTVSIGALVVTLLVAATLAVPRGRRRPVRLAVLCRALFPRRLLRSASGRADLAYCAFGVLVFGLAFGWAMLSADWIAGATASSLRAVFGPIPASPVPVTVGAAITTVALFLAYEFAYWFDHYISHKLPFLWHFHRVHHSAESLSLLTNFRVHPVDTIVFANLVALMTGITGGVFAFGFGPGGMPFAIGGTNILVLVFAVCLTHLQHAHFPVSFGRRGDLWLLSPLHHQIHHSTDARHFDRNFGSSLALWDRLFGTLYVPAALDAPLRFGLGPTEIAPHGLRAAVITPVEGALGPVLRLCRPPRRGARRRG